MELIIGIIAFVVISVITDAIEGNKKKGKLPPQKRRQTPRQAQTKAQQPVPKIKMEPQAQVYHASNTAALYRGKLSGGRKDEPQRESAPIISAAPGKEQLKPADIHSDVLLHAVAYAQILQPPKAYQYMATRSCRGEWNNNK